MSLSNICRDQYWSGELTPYYEDGQLVTEEYGGIAAKLLTDDTRDYLTFDHYPSEQELSDFYNSEYPATRTNQWYNANQQYRSDRWTGIAEPVLTLAQTFDRERRSIRVHDVGCGFGGLVEHLRGFGLDATGSDVCEQAIEGGRAEKDNRSIHHGTASDVLATIGRQDVIVLHHSLEHVRDPQQLVADLSAWLTEGGYLIVRSPNSRFYRSLHDGIRSHWYGYPKHLHYFGPDSLKKLLENCGLTDVTTTCTDSEMATHEELPLLRKTAGNCDEGFTDTAELLARLAARLENKELQGIGRMVHRG
jgi:2-polyprenyl-3-methyl-5-hydroxy-6-metoxy-1,4-benzoquinol methylase